MANVYAEKAAAIIESVGGKENITLASHCMTRLRLTLKDESLANDDVVKRIDGIIGVVHAGGQYQIIVGQSVPKVYEEVIKMTGLSAQEAIDENLDAPKDRSPKGIGKAILDYLSGSMVPLIPIMMAAAMFKTIQVVFGPDLLKLFAADSNIYRLLSFLYDAGFYFMPVYLGFSAARKIGASPVLGMYMGGILVAPALIEIVTGGQPFTVFGIPMRLVNYGSSVVPILLCVWILYYVEKFLRKIMPDALSTVFVPFCTMLIMVPLGLCLLAPLGSYIGDYVGKFFNMLSAHGGFLAVAMIGAFWEFLVMTGMHTVVIIPAIMALFGGQPDACVIVGGGAATAAAYGMALGAFLRIREKKEKSLALGYLVSGLAGGVSEPVLYGIGMRYKRPFIALIIGGFVGGLYLGLTKVKAYMLGATNVLGWFIPYAQGGTGNLINGILGSVIAFLATAALTYFIGFDKNDPAVK